MDFLVEGGGEDEVGDDLLIGLHVVVVTGDGLG